MAPFLYTAMQNPEVFYMLKGTLDFLQCDGDSNRWLASYAAGAVLNVDGGFTA